MKKAIIATFVFLAMQAIVPIVGAYIMCVMDSKPFDISSISQAVMNPTVIGIELLFTYLLTVGALYAWRMLTPVAGLVKRPKAIPLALLLMLLLIVIANIVNELMGLPDMAADALPALMGNPLCIACIALFGPILEEIVFRRAVIGSLIEGGYRPFVAIAISALFFAVVHMNPAQMPVAFITGFLLGWFYVRTGSLLVSILCHVMNNTLGVVMFHFAPEATLTSYLGGSVVAVAVALVCVAIGFFLVRLYNRKTEAAPAVTE